MISRTWSGWLGLRPWRLGLRTGWLACWAPGLGGCIDRQIDKETDKKPPHSTGLCPLSKPLPKITNGLLAYFLDDLETARYIYQPKEWLVESGVAWIYVIWTSFTFYKFRSGQNVFNRARNKSKKWKPLPTAMYIVQKRRWIWVVFLWRLTEVKHIYIYIYERR